MSGTHSWRIVLVACLAVAQVHSAVSLDCTFCPDSYDPVCGNDGQTYANVCKAKCAGIFSYTPGVCKPGAPKACGACTQLFSPVCGSDGVTYDNDCYLRCAQVELLYWGPCEEALPENPPPFAGAPGFNSSDAPLDPVAHSPPPPVRSPPPLVNSSPPPLNCSSCPALDGASVCGVDGRTYETPCLAACKGVTVLAKGPCTPKEGCICAQVYQPVCGSDLVTYPNSCVAGCAGITQVTDGACAPTVLGRRVPASLCSCPITLSAACGVNNVTYASECQAVSCNGTWVAYSGTCKKECNSCPPIAQPVCAFNTSLANSTFLNPCFASCNGIPANTTYPGKCNATCQARCSAFEAKPSWVCCPGGREFPSSCHSNCTLTEAQQAKCRPGKCGAEDVLELLNKCPPGSPVALCDSEPCQRPRCLDHADSYCVSNLCPKYWRGSLLGSVCSATYLDSSSGGVVSCGNTTLPCSECGVGYRPVCASDKKTYPNKCLATCLGLKVEKQGKCNECSHGACKCPTKEQLCRRDVRDHCCAGLKCVDDGPDGRAHLAPQLLGVCREPADRR